MKHAIDKRQSVIDVYSTIIGRNIYSQPLRNYCFIPYKGNYYSDCSSSICLSYKQAGYNFGLLNTAGMYTSEKLAKVDVIIKNGIIQNPHVLRQGDMLLFVGNDASRPLKIGHVEMVHHQSEKGTWIICGHGSGTPSYKDLNDYCDLRYSLTAPGGWRKGVVCVKRYIQDDPVSPKRFGWHYENGRWRYYLGDREGYAADYVKGDWYQWKSEKDNNLYWSFFLGDTGFAVVNDWYHYKDSWYFFDENAVMQSSRWIIWKNKHYYFDREGKMISNKYVKSGNREVWYWCSSDGSWDTSKDSIFCPPISMTVI